MNAPDLRALLLASRLAAERTGQIAPGARLTPATLAGEFLAQRPDAQEALVLLGQVEVYLREVLRDERQIRRVK